MNLTQAKAIAGIDQHVNISSRESAEHAVKCCTNLAALYHPDRNPNSRAAAEKYAQIMEARAYFKKRIPHGCAVCGVTIGRGATHCQLHKAGRSVRTLPAADNWQPESSPKGNGRARVSFASDPLALGGYYTAPVQKVIAKWRQAIGETMLQRYFNPVSLAVVNRDTKVDLPFVAPKHWGAVFELGSAVVKVVEDLTKPYSWLMRLTEIHVATNGVYLSCGAIRQMIIDNGGKPFTSNNIAQALSTMKLATPEAVRKDFRESVIKKRG